MLKHYFKHNFINHSKGEYVRNDMSRVAFKITTNSVEGVFAQMKRGINGIFAHSYLFFSLIRVRFATHWCSKKHLQKYLNEFNFKYNSKELADNQKFVFFLEPEVGVSQTAQGRLKYVQLIGRA